MQGLRRNINDIAQAQRGLVTRADLRAAGVTRAQRIRLQREGTLAAIGRQTFELGGLPADPRRPLLAACLDTGGILSHRSAAWLHGFGAEPDGLPEVLVGRRGCPNEASLARIHTTTWLPLDDRHCVDGIPCTSVARTLFSLAGLVPEVPLDLVRGAVDEAIRTGKASDNWLWWRLEKLRCRGRSGVSVFEAVLSARAGGELTESWLEREFLRLLRSALLPAPVCQRRIRANGAFVARVDFLYEDFGIVIEVTGARGHSSRDQRAADARRRNHLSTLGYLVLEFTYEQVVGEPDAVFAELHQALAARAPGYRRLAPTRH